MSNQKVMRSQGLFTWQGTLHCSYEVGTSRAMDGKHELLAGPNRIGAAGKERYQSMIGKKRQRGSSGAPGGSW
jgi:hypothetical protein